MGTTDAALRGTARLAGIAKTETYTRRYAESNGFLTLLGDGRRVVGAYALGPFPTFSEVYVEALNALRAAAPPT